ncbi:uncharacterized protein E0L32_011614 [Thyridium curvatum]|uniref:Amidohydrolase 3 domain-containing protein n=1 Tax=Thyridium curvatum TaxID=1093900 RepID=A0A507BMQ9_9PEZI|nr:uncharacterized protein E0L32_011614 [Thyridium curvatum]TPX18501.1 hypothetical protein E0L32_011614 [Thyridium curvatum]
MGSQGSTAPPGGDVLLVNGQIFQSSGEGGASKAQFHKAMLVRGGVIQHVGSEDDEPIRTARASSSGGIPVQDLRGQTVLPGFFDGHLHILILGQSLAKVSLDHCKSLQDIRAAIREYAAANPDVPRIFCKGWMHSMTPDGVDHTLLDDLDPRPIFVDTKDLHSTWVSAAAIAELGLQDTPSPEGGEIHRFADGGRPTGLLSEAAVFNIIWPFVAAVASVEERAEAVRQAMVAYSAAGYTGMIDMAMDENILEAVLYLRARWRLPLRLAAYWLVKPDADPAAHAAQVDRAAELAALYNDRASPDFRVVGVKVICDGIVDACTASLTEPYAANAKSTDPFWPPEALARVVRRADAAGLQVALHAIGDRTVAMVVDALEAHASRERRPRVEHLELASARDAARLGALGITASVQAVHADPAILRAWPALLGERRCGRAFAYREFADGGATLALGSDAPTAPHGPLANAYVATTRRSAREPGYEVAVNPHFALGLCEAVVAGTRGAAYSCFADGVTGSLEPGKRADFVVVEMEWAPEKLLGSKVLETWFDGRRVFKASSEED